MVQTVRLTIDIAQLPDTYIDVPIVQVVQVPLYLTVSFLIWCSSAEYEKLVFLEHFKTFWGLLKSFTTV